MHRHRPALLLIASLALLLAALPAAAADPAPAASSPREVRVLFIGNSLTYFHDLPKLFTDFSNATWPGLKVTTEAVTAPGESLKGHWDAGRALAKIRGAHWDYVVLQDQGGVAIGMVTIDGTAQAQSPDEYWDYGGRFARAAADAGARAVLYQTYESKNSERSLPYIDYATYTLGGKSGAVVAPVAQVWHRVKTAPGLDLYHTDGAHPSPLGSYLAAVTLAATMFGDVADPAAAWHPEAVPAAQMKPVLAALGAVRGELAKSGGTPRIPVPKFVDTPRLEPTLPWTAATAAGSWTALANGFDISFGTRLTVRFEDAAPKVELVDYTLHGAFTLPIEDLAVTGGVLRFNTRSQYRTYRFYVAPRDSSLAVLVEQLRGKSYQYTHVDYRRNGEPAHFAFLDQQYATIAQAPTQEAFEAALLAHYEALSQRLGADRLAKTLMGSGPLGDPWWSILTAWELKRQRRHDEAIRFLTFSTHRFPQSASAFENLSEGLEAAGRTPEAHAAILRAEALVPADETQLRQLIAEVKARLEKAAAPAAAASSSS